MKRNIIVTFIQAIVATVVIFILAFLFSPELLEHLRFVEVFFALWGVMLIVNSIIILLPAEQQKKDETSEKKPQELPKWLLIGN